MPHGEKRARAGQPKSHGKYGETTQAIRLPIGLINSVMKFVANKGYQWPLFCSKVAAAFRSPTDDYLKRAVDLHALVIHHPAAPFLVRASWQSMMNATMHKNDLLIVDRRIKPTHGKLVIATINDQLTVKRLQQSHADELIFMPENLAFKSIQVKRGNEVYIWAVVTCVVHVL